MLVNGLMAQISSYVSLTDDMTQVFIAFDPMNYTKIKPTSAPLIQVSCRVSKQEGYVLYDAQYLQDMCCYLQAIRVNSNETPC
jgi:hypothetical protein